MARYKRSYELETDHSAASRARMRVYLEDLDCTWESNKHWNCPAWAEWQAAIDTLSRLIDEWPYCECEAPVATEPVT